MIAFKPSLPPASGANGANPGPENLKARLEAATEALLKTRDQVVEALDHHLNELDMLRRALATSEKNAVPMAQAPAVESPAPVATPHYFERPPQAPAPVLPMLTQVLWPSKHDEPAAAPARPFVPAAETSHAPVSSPLVAYSSLQGSSSRDLPMDPDLERATLEELNTALAYAFSHVSSARSGSNPASNATPMMAPAGGTSWANSGT